MVMCGVLYIVRGLLLTGKPVCLLAGRFFYQRLVEFMASGPMRAYILAHEDAIKLWRDLMGPTKVFRARYIMPESIRGLYGLTDTRNTTHGSDSFESAKREMAIFFPEFSVSSWYEQEEPHFRLGAVTYNQEKLIHTVHQDKDTIPSNDCTKDRTETETSLKPKSGTYANTSSLVQC
ncbi:nucleoside diphosphate kinase 6 isoform X2 [Lissotriton helveticus]